MGMKPLRFSLRTLLIVVAGVGIVLGWLFWNVRQVRTRDALLARPWIVFTGVGVKPLRDRKSLPWIWEVLGAESVQDIWAHPGCSDDICQQLTRAFPEADLHREDAFKSMGLPSPEPDTPFP